MGKKAELTKELSKVLKKTKSLTKELAVLVEKGQAILKELEGKPMPKGDPGHDTTGDDV